MQRINLLSALPPQPKKYFNAKQIVLIMGCWLVLLLIIYGFLEFKFLQKNSVYNHLSKRKAGLLVEIDYTIQQIAFKKQANAGVNSGGSTVFSNCLEKLAQITPAGIWMQKISLNANNDLNFEGKMVSLLSMPEFLKNLSVTQIISNNAVSTFKLTKGNGEKEAKVINFVLNSKTEKTVSPTNGNNPKA